VLRRKLVGTLTLLGTLLAPAGVARAQSGPVRTQSVPAPAPPGLDAAALPLVPEPPSNGDSATVARKVIASSQPELPASVGLVPVPDDGLGSGAGAMRLEVRSRSAPAATLRTAVYRPDVDAGPVELVGGPGAPLERVAAPRTATAARLDLQLDGPPEVTPGKPFVYVIRVRSSGTAPAAAARITDRLPPGVRLVGADPKPEIAGDRLTWELGDLPPGAERRLTVTVDTEKVTSAFVVRPMANFGVGPGLRVAPGRPQLELRLIGPESAVPGATVPYRVLIANNGTSSLQRVNVLVKLTPGLRHPSLGRGDAIEADVVLAAGETKTLPLELLAGVAGMNGITASARAEGGPSAEAHTAVAVDMAARISSAAYPTASHMRAEISTLSEAVSIGATVIYEVRLINPDDVAQTGIRVLAMLTEGLEPEQADGPAASAVTAHGVVFETLRRLGPGDSAVYHVRAHAKRAGVQQLRVEVNADRLAQPTTAEASTWVAPGRGR
jgi:uncharacterized repeat protein (TIGR01451 family)